MSDLVHGLIPWSAVAAQPAPFSISESGDQDGVLVRLSGELDVVSAGQVNATLRRVLQAGQRLTVDLAEVTFIDSTGLAAIVKGPESDTERALLVLRPSRHEQPQRLLKLTNVSELFTFEPAT